MLGRSLLRAFDGDAGFVEPRDRLGNFGVTEVSENETWVTVAEWMQTWGPNVVIPPDNKYGADNSVYAARILWDE